jgi:hypothetical protein
MAMDDGLEAMRQWIGRHDWSGLESEFDRRCREADGSLASRIADIDLRDYEDELADCLRKAAGSIGGSTKAVYWEFDPDNDWSSSFFLSRSYRSEAEGDDGWAADFDEQAIAPLPGSLTRGGTTVHRGLPRTLTSLPGLLPPSDEPADPGHRPRPCAPGSTTRTWSFASARASRPRDIPVRQAIASDSRSPNIGAWSGTRIDLKHQGWMEIPT